MRQLSRECQPNYKSRKDRLSRLCRSIGKGGHQTSFGAPSADLIPLAALQAFNFSIWTFTSLGMASLGMGAAKIIDGHSNMVQDAVFRVVATMFHPDDREERPHIVRNSRTKSYYRFRMTQKRIAQVGATPPILEFRSATGAWLTAPDRRGAVRFALDLVPFAGIAFSHAFLMSVRERGPNSSRRQREIPEFRLVAVF